MHELSICMSLAEIVARHAAGRPVAVVHIEVGQLRQVIPETLRYSWDIVVEGTPLAGSSLTVDEVPARVECRGCGAVTTLEAPVFRCGCGSGDLRVVSGRELLVRALELSTVAAPT